MTKRALRQYAWLGLAVAVAAALVVAWRASRQIDFYRTQIDARMGERAELSTLSRASERAREAFHVLEGQQGTSERLEAVAKRTLTDIEADLALRERSLVGEGWYTYRYDMRLERVDAKRLDAFLAACEEARPRIRIDELQVSAVEGDPRVLAVQLSLAELVPPDLGSEP